MRGCERARSASARWPPSPDTARPPHSPVPSPAALVKPQGRCCAAGVHRCSQGPIRYRAWSCLLGALVIPPRGRAPWLLLLEAETDLQVRRGSVRPRRKAANRLRRSGLDAARVRRRTRHSTDAVAYPTCRPASCLGTPGTLTPRGQPPPGTFRTAAALSRGLAYAHYAMSVLAAGRACASRVAGSTPHRRRRRCPAAGSPVCG